MFRIDIYYYYFFRIDAVYISENRILIKNTMLVTLGQNTNISKIFWQQLLESKLINACYLKKKKFETESI